MAGCTSLLGNETKAQATHLLKRLSVVCGELSCSCDFLTENRYELGILYVFFWHITVSFPFGGRVVYRQTNWLDLACTITLCDGSVVVCFL
jgi:hypothetical protein